MKINASLSALNSPRISIENDAEEQLDWRTAISSMPHALDPFASSNVATSALRSQHVYSKEFGELDHI